MQPLHPATEMEKPYAYILMKMKYHTSNVAAVLFYLAKVQFFIWVGQTSEFSWATIQVDIARPKSWEKTNL